MNPAEETPQQEPQPREAAAELQPAASPDAAPAQSPDGAPEAGLELAPPAPRIPALWRWVIGAAIAAVLAYPIIRNMGGGSAPAGGTPSPADQLLLNTSYQQIQSGQFDGAIKTSQQLLQANPKSADAYNNLAVAYLGLKQYDLAIQSAEQAVRLNPDYQLAKNNLAWARQEKDKASGVPAPAAPSPNTPEFFLNQSLTLYQAGKYQECIDAARQALKLRPDYAEAYNNIAAAYASMSRWDDAIQNAQQALRSNPNYQLARNNLAWALSKKAGK